MTFVIWIRQQASYVVVVSRKDRTETILRVQKRFNFKSIYYKFVATSEWAIVLIAVCNSKILVIYKWIHSTAKTFYKIERKITFPYFSTLSSNQSLSFKAHALLLMFLHPFYHLFYNWHLPPCKKVCVIVFNSSLDVQPAARCTYS